MTVLGFVTDKIVPGATVYTDDSRAYTTLPSRECVNHSIREFVKGEVHANGVESFWSMLKRAHKGTFHKLSPKHLNRYVQEFVAKHNTRQLDTLDQMRLIASRSIGRSLLYRNLIQYNGFD